MIVVDEVRYVTKPTTIMMWAARGLGAGGVNGAGLQLGGGGGARAA
jgi:hypothetical protein